MFSGDGSAGGLGAVFGRRLGEDDGGDTTLGSVFGGDSVSGELSGDGLDGVVERGLGLERGVWGGEKRAEASAG